jgi:hypothetical protein
LSDLASGALNNNRRGKNTVHRLGGIFRQSVYGRLAGYEDVNDADRLALDPVIIRSCARLSVAVQSRCRQHRPRRWDGSRPRHNPMSHYVPLC